MELPRIGCSEVELLLLPFVGRVSPRAVVAKAKDKEKDKAKAKAKDKENAKAKGVGVGPFDLGNSIIQK